MITRWDKISIVPQIHFYDLKHILKLAPKQWLKCQKVYHAFLLLGCISNFCENFRWDLSPVIIKSTNVYCHG